MANEINLIDHWIEYTENTSIHGIKYLGRKQRSFRENTFWIVIFIISFIFLGFFVQNVVVKFKQKSVILVEDDYPTPIHSIPFPAVTICPTTKIKNKFLPAEQALLFSEGKFDGSMIGDLLYLICNQQLVSIIDIEDEKSFTQYLNKSHIELLHKVSPLASRMFASVDFMSENQLNYIAVGNHTIQTIPFSYILTNEGICFTFNLPSEIIGDDSSLQTEYKYHNIPNKSISWNNQDGYYGYPRFPTSVWGSGPGSGLKLVLVSYNEDLHTVCQPTRIGYKIMLHSPDEYPTTIKKFIPIQHNSIVEIKVMPKITKTSPDLSQLDPQVRQCYLKGERNLKYFTYYNRVNCKLECLANYTLQQYGCVHFSLPRNNTQPICGPKIKIRKIYDTEEIMNSYFHFKESIRREYTGEIIGSAEFSFQKFVKFDCNCLPACNFVDYEYSAEKEDMNNEKLKERYYPDDKNDFEPVVAMDIFFDLTKVTGTTRKRFYTFSDLIANIGGLMGLFMGASILSVFEIIYFLIVRRT